jgi:hypothetical protein
MLLQSRARHLFLFSLPIVAGFLPAETARRDTVLPTGVSMQQR